MNKQRRNKKLELVADVAYRNDNPAYLEDDDRFTKRYYRSQKNKSKAQRILERNKEKW